MILFLSPIHAARFDMHKYTNMKKIIFCILIIHVFSVGYLKAENFEGFIITKNNDTLKATFDIPVLLFTKKIQFERIQSSIKVFDKNNESRKLNPKLVKEIVFTYQNKKVRMISKHTKIEEDSVYIFYRLLIDGKLKLYKYYYYVASPGMNGMVGFGGVASDFILEKEGGKLFSPRSLSFRKDMNEYITDCGELMKKINDRVYGRDALEKIVTEYNNKCGK